MSAVADDIKKNTEQIIKDVQDDIKNTTPKEWGISAAISLLIILIINVVTAGKEEHVISAGAFLCAGILAVASVTLRRKPICDQYPIAVVILAFARLLTEIKPFTLLLLAVIPIIVNYVRREIKSN